ncbi:hypothetical protein D1007_00601 [Hordeum vulgare]|nr:hypothetical protein D1007_00601 [Hordeum vulgare]
MLRGGLNGTRGFRGGHSPPLLAPLRALFLLASRERRARAFVFFIFAVATSVDRFELSPPANMARGSSSKRSLAQQASLQGAWLGSDVEEELIDALRHHRLLPPASQVSVHLPGFEASPAPIAGEVVVFAEHFYRGFGLPASSFFAEWLQFFGLQPHHLAPNAILELAAFVVLCEGFVGIEPRVDLWRSLFFFKQQSIAMEKSEKGFFYMRSIDPAQDALNMPPFTIAPPTRHNWDAKTPKSHPEVALIRGHPDILRESGLLGRDLLATMVMFKTLQGSLPQPAPDVVASGASELEDEDAMEPRSDSSAGTGDPLESEGTEPSGEYPRHALADWMDDDEEASFYLMQPSREIPTRWRREAEDADEDTATAAERAGWAAADAADRELVIESKRRWDTAAGKTAMGQPCLSRVERPTEKRAKARQDPSAHARAE